MAITAQMVKALRDKTGCGMMDCKKALQETGADEEQAVAWLREKGLAKAQKRAGKATSEGWIGLFIDDSGKNATMVEVKCETDFVAKGEQFQTLARQIADVVGKNAPTAATPGPVPEEIMTKPLLDGLSLQDKLNEMVAVVGENLQIGSYARFEMDGPGMIGNYIHSTGKIGVLIEVKCENDASTGKDAFKDLAKDLAMQIAAANPVCVEAGQVPADILEREKEIYENQAKEEGKPAHIAEKIVEGRLKKFYKDICLLDQPYIRDDSMSVSDLLKNTGKDLDDKISIGRFARMSLGETD